MALEALKTQDLLRQQLVLSGQQKTLCGQELVDLKAEVDANRSLLQTWQKRANDAEEGEIALEQKLAAWYHSPWIMVAVGFAGGIVVTGVLVTTLHK